MNEPLFITTLAEYQTAFWLPVAEERKRRGKDTEFLSFDDASSSMLARAGFTVHASSARSSAAAIDLRRFGIDRLNYWLTHERVAFGLKDSGEMLGRLRAYVELADRALRAALSAGRRPVLVQELGGFISVVASFFAARANGIDNWFIEPSFFRGRLFFLKNAFAAPKIRAELPREASPAVARYLADTQASQAIVIPRKDRHQYTSALRKIVNLRNARRLGEKLLDKHLRGRHQEFGHIGHHVGTHLRMLANSIRLRGVYGELSTAKPFVYYPLHVPGDMALTLRSPEYLDQLALVDFIARCVPHSHRVAIKEHPAMIGALPRERLLALLSRYDNLVLLPPQLNNYDVLQAADAVVSVNSKSGAEALLLGKPVLVLGDAFYRDSPLVIKVERLADLAAAIEKALRGPSPARDRALVERYFEAVWQSTLPGELYVPEASNIVQFVDSLERLG